MPDTPTPYDSNQEPETRCVHCPRLLHFDELSRWACRICEDRAGEQLTEIHSMYGQLRGKLVPALSTADNAGHVTGATRSAPLPVSLGALDLIAPGGIATKLQSIEDDWRKTLGWTVAPFRGNAEQTLESVIPFLRNNLPWACSMYEDVSEDLKLIGILHRRTDAVIHGQREARVPVGYCPTVSDSGEVCGEGLRVSPWALQIRCNGCGTSWHRDQWLRLGAVMRGLPVPGAA
jgi:hypothetical protein